MRYNKTKCVIKGLHGTQSEVLLAIIGLGSNRDIFFR